MRLTADQITNTHSVLKKYFSKIDYELFLYGSRTDDTLKGGDIDLLIITTEEGVKTFEKFNLDILVDLKKQPSIGQRRIDLKAATQSDLTRVPFLKHISITLVKI